MKEKGISKLFLFFLGVVLTGTAIGGFFIYKNLAKRSFQKFGRCRISCDILPGQNYCRAEGICEIKTTQKVSILTDCTNCVINPIGCFSCARIRKENRKGEIVFDCINKKYFQTLAPGNYWMETSTNCGSASLEIKCKNCRLKESEEKPLIGKTTKLTPSPTTEKKETKETKFLPNKEEFLKILARSCNIKTLHFKTLPSGQIPAVKMDLVLKENGRLDKLSGEIEGLSFPMRMVWKNDKLYGVTSYGGKDMAMISIPLPCHSAYFPSNIPKNFKIIGEEIFDGKETIIVEFEVEGKKQKVWYWKKWGIPLKTDPGVTFTDVRVNQSVRPGLFDFAEPPSGMQQLMESVFSQAGLSFEQLQQMNICGFYKDDPNFYTREEICK